MNGQAALASNEVTPLYEYGIFNEKSHFRAHVAPIAKTVFVFRTNEMIDYLNQNECIEKPAYQKGVNQCTARGRLVPHNINIVRPIYWHSHDWWKSFDNNDSTTVKGEKAVSVVTALMSAGRFPFWVIPKEIQDVQIDISGTDIIVTGSWKTQVKCDFTAGPKTTPGCTGNLYIQTHEVNPLRMY